MIPTLCLVAVVGLLSCTIGWMLLEQFVQALRAGRFVWFIDWLARKRGWPRDKGEQANGNTSTD